MGVCSSFCLITQAREVGCVHGIFHLRHRSAARCAAGSDFKQNPGIVKIFKETKRGAKRRAGLLPFPGGREPGGAAVARPACSERRARGTGAGQGSGHLGAGGSLRAQASAVPCEGSASLGRRQVHTASVRAAPSHCCRLCSATSNSLLTGLGEGQSCNCGQE